MNQKGGTTMQMELEKSELLKNIQEKTVKT